MKEYWDKIYSDTENSNTSWYEEFPAPAVEILKECVLDKNDKILIAGAGISSFVNYLADEGYKNIIATDISSVALEKLKVQLGTVKNESVRFIADDLTQPKELDKLNDIALWYDRAVLHFFTNVDQKNNYFTLLKKIVKPGGYVIIAEFSPEGPKKCSGLDTLNYDENIIQKYLGTDFELIKSLDYLYTTPSGKPRAYIYTLFQRKYKK